MSDILTHKGKTALQLEQDIYMSLLDLYELMYMWSEDENKIVETHRSLTDYKKIINLAENLLDNVQGIELIIGTNVVFRTKGKESDLLLFNIDGVIDLIEAIDVLNGCNSDCIYVSRYIKHLNIISDPRSYIEYTLQGYIALINGTDLNGEGE